VNGLRAALIDIEGTLWPELGPPSDSNGAASMPFLDSINNKPRGWWTLNRAVSSWESPSVLQQDTDTSIGEVLCELGIPNIGGRAIREAMCVPASDGAALARKRRSCSGRSATSAYAGPREQHRLAGCRGLQTGLRLFRRERAHLGNHHVARRRISLTSSRNLSSRVRRCPMQCTGECVVVGDSEEKDIAPPGAQ
jgi:hypothetical protein